MAAVAVSTPLASLALPTSGTARRVAEILLVIAGSVLLAISAKAKVVLGPVDLSLQTLAVLGIAATFGFRLGMATMILYLIEGAAGLPVFQSTPEKGLGIAYMLFARRWLAVGGPSADAPAPPSLATWIALEPHPSVRLSAGLERRERTGSLGRVTSSRGETALSFGTAFAF